MSKVLFTKNDDPFVVDDEDFDRVSNVRWHSNGNGYIRGWVTRNEERQHILLHRYILDVPDGMEVDHINHNVFDNRKSNLRIVTLQQNAKNKLFQPKSEAGEYVSFSDAKKMLGYSGLTSVYSLVKKHNLKKYKILGKSYLSMNDIEALLTPRIESPAEEILKGE